MSTPIGSRLAASAALLLAAAAQGGTDRMPPQLHAVQPVGPTQPAPGAADLEIVRGRHFSYALPRGWHAAEDGPFAVTLVAPDNRAFTLMAGNAGMRPDYPLDRYVQEKLAAIRAQSVRLGTPRAVAARPGFAQAFQFEVSYVSARGIPSRGLATCNVAPAYDSKLLVLTGAFAVEAQWPDYATWLPLSAAQIVATDGAAFGRRGIMAQNLQHTQEYGEAARAYREWSQRTAQEVGKARADAGERKNYYVRENLGPSRAYTNPYDPATPVDLPRDYKYYWVNRQGKYAGTNDASVNPNEGSTAEWKPMPPHQP